jgi:hypothetical protein
MISTRYRKAFCVLLLIVALQGCSTVPEPQGWLSPGREIGIHDAELLHIDSQVDSTLKANSKGLAMGVAGATGGAAAGAVVGAAYGLACGPFAIICSPAGALTGGVLGLVGGSSAGQNTRGSGITGAKAERFNHLSRHYLDTADNEATLKRRFSQLIEANWLTQAGSANSVRLAVTRLYFRQTGEEFLQLAAEARVTIQVDGRTAEHHLSEASTNAFIDYWLAGNGSNLVKARDAVMTRLLNQSASLLAGDHWAPDLELLEYDHEGTL